MKIEDAKAEIARFEAARDQAAEELKGLYDKAVKEDVYKRQEMGDSILKEFSRLLERKKVMAACRMYSDYFLVLSRGCLLYTSRCV